MTTQLDNTLSQNKYNKIKRLINYSIALNNKLHIGEKADKLRDWIGLLNYHQEYKTVRLELGRQIGKTTYINEYLKNNEDGIVFVSTTQSKKQAYKEHPSKCFAINRMNPEVDFKGKDNSHIKKIFIDDATWFNDLDLIYQLFSQDGVENLYIIRVSYFYK